MVSGITCVLCSLFISIYTHNQEENAKTFSNEIAINFAEQIIPSNSPTSPTSTISSMSYTNEYENDIATIEIDNQDYIGLLCIPSLDLVLPIDNTWNYDLLKKTPCAFSGTIENKNLIIAGHNYKSHFGYLDTLKTDDTAYILDAYGTIHNYEISLIETLAADEISALLYGEWDLTLFTCVSLNNTYRCVIRLNEINV